MEALTSTATLLYLWRRTCPPTPFFQRRHDGKTLLSRSGIQKCPAIIIVSLDPPSFHGILQKKRLVF